MTPYYEEKGIQIYHGDCRDIIPYLPEIELEVVTDPPYDQPDVVGVLEQWVRKAVFGYPELLCGWCATWGQPDEWVTWWPTNKFGHGSKTLPRNTECIAIFGPLYEMPTRRREADASTVRIARAQGNIVSADTSRAREGDVWRDAAPGIGFNAHQRKHPNEKPESLMARLIKLCTSGCDVILDTYMGSGTTLVAARRLGRKAIGIEIKEKYCEVAANRLRQEMLRFESVA